MLKHLLFIAILVAGGYYYWITRPITHGPGEVAPKEPVQEKAFGIKDIQYKDFTIVPLAKFNMEARVLAIKRYYADERTDLFPYDVVFGWGPMSDERNLDHMLIKQSDRDYKWEMTKPPIPMDKMALYSENMHLISSNQMIEEKIGELRPGHVVKINGYLVKASSEKGWTVTSSLTRSDKGRGSSEIIWVKELEIL